MKAIEAYSEQTNTTYPNWDALVAAEANGYVVVAVITRNDKTWPWVIGPFDTVRKAENARARARTRLKRELKIHPWSGTAFSLFVRPLWKDEP